MGGPAAGGDRERDRTRRRGPASRVLRGSDRLDRGLPLDEHRGSRRLHRAAARAGGAAHGGHRVAQRRRHSRRTGPRRPRARLRRLLLHVTGCERRHGGGALRWHVRCVVALVDPRAGRRATARGHRRRVRAARQAAACAAWRARRRVRGSARPDRDDRRSRGAGLPHDHRAPEAGTLRPPRLDPGQEDLRRRSPAVRAHPLRRSVQGRTQRAAVEPQGQLWRNTDIRGGAPLRGREGARLVRRGSLARPRRVRGSWLPGRDRRLWPRVRPRLARRVGPRRTRDRTGRCRVGRDESGDAGTNGEGLGSVRADARVQALHGYRRDRPRGVRGEGGPLHRLPSVRRDVRERRQVDPRLRRPRYREGRLELLHRAWSVHRRDVLVQLQRILEHARQHGRRDPRRQRRERLLRRGLFRRRRRGGGGGSW